MTTPSCRPRAGGRPGALRLAVAGLLAIALVTPWLGTARAEGPHTREYDLKAAFLFNFARFVSWPREAFADPYAPLVIGVVGEDPFGRSLDEIVEGESVHGHPIVVRRFRTPSEIGSCHILFVSRSEVPRLPEIRETIGSRSVLLVSDAPGFASRGGVVEFAPSGSRLRLLIHASRARSMGLAISSQLLRQSQLVGGS